MSGKMMGPSYGSQAGPAAPLPAAHHNRGGPRPAPKRAASLPHPFFPLLRPGPTCQERKVKDRAGGHPDTSRTPLVQSMVGSDEVTIFHHFSKLKIHQNIVIFIVMVI